MFFNSSDKRRKECKLFDSGFGHFDAENIDIVLTENAENPFVAIISIVSLINLYYFIAKIFCSLEKFTAKMTYNGISHFA